MTWGFGFLTLMLGCSAVFYLLFRLWTFTIRPALHPAEPKELPYWIPYIGHAIEFVKNGQQIITKGRMYFNNTREPFALTLGGEKLYFLTSPEDVSTLYKHTTAFAFDKIVHELTITFGVSRTTVDMTFKSPPSLEEDVAAHALHLPNPKLKSLAGLNSDLWKQQMVPGPRYYNLQDLFAKYLRATLDPRSEKFSGRGLIRSPDGGHYLASLLPWSQRVLIDAGLRAFFGDILLETEPQIVDDFLTFDDDNWQLWYKWPRADAMYGAKARVAEALQRYVALPESRRQGASFIVEAFFKGQRALGTSNVDLANILAMVVFVTNTNTYKVSFWAVAYMMRDSELLSRINAETSGAFIPDGSIDQKYLANSCPWLSALFHEALRVCSASSSIRLVTETTYIGTKKLLRGSRVMVPFRQMHFNEHVYPHPDTFDPERFIRNDKLANSSSFRPFGGGLSLCPGRFLAKQEVCIFIALLLHNFDLSIDKGQRFPELDSGKPTTGLMNPKPGEDMILRLKIR